MERPIFRFDNAKSQMSTCKTCRKIIAFQALRVGVTDYNEGRLMYLRGMEGGWNHLDCFFRRSPYLWWIKDHVLDYRSVQGYGQLSLYDQQKVDKEMEKLQERHVEPPKGDDSEYVYDPDEERDSDDNEFTEPLPQKKGAMEKKRKRTARSERTHQKKVNTNLTEIKTERASFYFSNADKTRNMAAERMYTLAPILKTETVHVQTGKTDVTRICTPTVNMNLTETKKGSQLGEPRSSRENENTKMDAGNTSTSASGTVLTEKAGTSADASDGDKNEPQDKLLASCCEFTNVTVKTQHIHSDKYVSFAFSKARGFRATLITAEAPRAVNRRRKNVKIANIDHDAGISLSQLEWESLLEHAALINKLVGIDDTPMTDDEKRTLGLDDNQNKPNRRNAKRRRKTSIFMMESGKPNKSIRGKRKKDLRRLESKRKKEMDKIRQDLLETTATVDDKSKLTQKLTFPKPRSIMSSEIKKEIENQKKESEKRRREHERKMREQERAEREQEKKNKRRQKKKRKSSGYDTNDISSGSTLFTDSSLNLSSLTSSFNSSDPHSDSSLLHNDTASTKNQPSQSSQQQGQSSENKLLKDLKAFREIMKEQPRRHTTQQIQEEKKKAQEAALAKHQEELQRLREENIKKNVDDDHQDQRQAMLAKLRAKELERNMEEDGPFVLRQNTSQPPPLMTIDTKKPRMQVPTQQGFPSSSHPSPTTNWNNGAPQSTVPKGCAARPKPRSHSSSRPPGILKKPGAGRGWHLAHLARSADNSFTSPVPPNRPAGNIFRPPAPIIFRPPALHQRPILGAVRHFIRPTATVGIVENYIYSFGSGSEMAPPSQFDFSVPPPPRPQGLQGGMNAPKPLTSLQFDPTYTLRWQTPGKMDQVFTFGRTSTPTTQNPPTEDDGGIQPMETTSSVTHNKLFVSLDKTAQNIMSNAAKVQESLIRGNEPYNPDISLPINDGSPPIPTEDKSNNFSSQKSGNGFETSTESSNIMMALDENETNTSLKTETEKQGMENGNSAPESDSSMYELDVEENQEYLIDSTKDGNVPDTWEDLLSYSEHGLNNSIGTNESKGPEFLTPCQPQDTSAKDTTDMSEEKTPKFSLRQRKTRKKYFRTLSAKNSDSESKEESLFSKESDDETNEVDNVEQNNMTDNGKEANVADNARRLESIWDILDQPDDSQPSLVSKDEEPTKSDKPEKNERVSSGSSPELTDDLEGWTQVGKKSQIDEEKKKKNTRFSSVPHNDDEREKRSNKNEDRRSNKGEQSRSNKGEQSRSNKGEQSRSNKNEDSRSNTNEDRKSNKDEQRSSKKNEERWSNRNSSDSNEERTSDSDKGRLLHYSQERRGREKSLADGMNTNSGQWTSQSHETGSGQWRRSPSRSRETVSGRRHWRRSDSRSRADRCMNWRQPDLSDEEAYSASHESGLTKVSQEVKRNTTDSRTQPTTTNNPPRKNSSRSENTDDSWNAPSQKYKTFADAAKGTSFHASSSELPSDGKRNERKAESSSEDLNPEKQNPTPRYPPQVTASPVTNPSVPAPPVTVSSSTASDTLPVETNAGFDLKTWYLLSLQQQQQQLMLMSTDIQMKLAMLASSSTGDSKLLSTLLPTTSLQPAISSLTNPLLLSAAGLNPAYSMSPINPNLTVTGSAPVSATSQHYPGTGSGFASVHHPGTSINKASPTTSDISNEPDETLRELSDGEIHRIINQFSGVSINNQSSQRQQSSTGASDVYQLPNKATQEAMTQKVIQKPSRNKTVLSEARFMKVLSQVPVKSDSEEENWDDPITYDCNKFRLPGHRPPSPAANELSGSEIKSLCDNLQQMTTGKNVRFLPPPNPVKYKPLRKPYSASQCNPANVKQGQANLEGNDSHDDYEESPHLSENLSYLNKSEANSIRNRTLVNSSKLKSKAVEVLKSSKGSFGSSNVPTQATESDKSFNRFNTGYDTSQQRRTAPRQYVGTDALFRHAMSGVKKENVAASGASWDMSDKQPNFQTYVPHSLNISQFKEKFPLLSRTRKD